MPRDCLSGPEEAIDVRLKGFPKHWGRVAKSAF